jgi:hypothetical protein
MKRTFITFAVSILTLSFFTACQAAGKPSAEQAAADMILAHPGEGVVVDPNSITGVQTQALDASTYVVITYQRMWNDRDELCLVLYETSYQMFTGWSSNGGGGMCSERETAGEEAVQQPLHVSTGMTNRSDQNKPDFSYVLGKIYDPQIKTVMVKWKDGQAQEAQVVDNTFTAIRSGRVEMKNTEGMNAGNTVIYTVTHD